MFFHDRHGQVYRCCECSEVVTGGLQDEKVVLQAWYESGIL